ncbi:MAG: hypothetical protein B7X55_03180 [Rhodobacterales bacterium 34-62-10]|nr:MAG: hypothetical protein B7X55_03180 [Rhodobacterales bacterium 34-62-10]
MTFETEMNVSDEMLMALADGELTGPDASKLMARIRVNPDLAARFALFTDTAEALREAMDPGPVPDYLISAVLTAPTGQAEARNVEARNTETQTTETRNSAASNVTPLRRKAATGTGQMVWPMALAASLVLAVGVGGFLTGRSLAPAPAGLETAASALAGTATGGSVTLADGSTARALGTFDTDVGLCRLIAVDGSDGHADRAVVCQADDTNWRTALSVTEGGAGMFLPASDMAVGMIDDFLDGIGAGAAMAPEDEARVLAR